MLPMYDADAMTDRSERFLASEIIREKVFRWTGDELPYTSTVVIDKFETEGRLRRQEVATAGESSDGRAILYKKDETNGPLFSVPIMGGPAKQVVPCVRGGRGFAARPQGIYYVACDAETNPPIRIRDWSTGM